MRKIILSFIRKALKDERGQALPWILLAMTGLLGVSGFTIDAGHAYVVRSQLQNAANAGALAAAGNVYNTSTTGDASAIASLYAGSSGDLNSSDSLVSTKTTIATKCLNLLMPAGTTCSTSAPVTPANAVQVTESASVPTFFMKILGISTIPVVAQATASMQGMAQPWNVAIIVDTTGSMATADSNCGSLTELQCSLSGIQSLLAATNPCPPGGCGSGANFRVSLFTFPNVLTAVNGALPKVGSTTYDSISNDINCSGTPATYKNYTHQPLAAPYTLPVPGAALLTYGGTGGAAARSTYQAGLEYLTYSNKVGSTTTTWEATYQITPFLSDYYAPTASSGLNTSSSIVKAVGYGTTSGCLTYTLGIDGTGSGSGFGNTYFASSIYAAQSMLAAEQASNPKSNNAIIFLSDGQANASYFSKDSSAYGGSSPYYNSTNQYNDATEFPEAPANSEVGPSTSSYPVPAYYTPATILTAQNTLGYDTLSSSSSSSGQKRSGTSTGVYPDWHDQCQQAIVAAQYAVNQGTRVYAVAYGSEASGCSNGWSVGATDTTTVATGTFNQPFTGSSILPCTTMEDIASSWSYFYSDNQQSGNVNLGCTDNNHSTISLADIFLAIASTFTNPRLLPNNAQ
jgi:Flp pilus assembly protein TadG